MSSPPLFGLVLAGGASTRMGRDKAAIAYHGRSQLEWTFALLSQVCAATFVSVRPDQRDEPARAGFAQVVDLNPGTGPIAGITAALQQHPKAAWLILACDLPFVTETVIANLIEKRDPTAIATAFRSAHDHLPEPLCAIWEPAAREGLLAYVASGKQCPRKFLIGARTKLIELPDARALDNVNTSDEQRAASEALGGSAGLSALRSGQNETRAVEPSAEASSVATTLSTQPSSDSRSLRLRIQYYALFREQAGRSEETIETNARTPAQLYRELQTRHPFELAPSQLKVAVNTDFRDWNSPLQSGDTVVFIPPVAGG